jgi:hypothetical protein
LNEVFNEKTLEKIIHESKGGKSGPGSKGGKRKLSRAQITAIERYLEKLFPEEYERFQRFKKLTKTCKVREI